MCYFKLFVGGLIRFYKDILGEGSTKYKCTLWWCWHCRHRFEGKRVPNSDCCAAREQQQRCQQHKMSCATIDIQFFSHFDCVARASSTFANGGCTQSRKVDLDAATRCAIPCTTRSVRDQDVLLQCTTLNKMLVRKYEIN